MIYDSFDDIQCVVVEKDSTQYLSFSEVMKLPTPKDYFNFLLFFFPNDNGYYEKPYIKECISSWKRVFPKSRLINVPIFEAQGLSKWSMITYHRKNFPTDSLRVLLASHLNNCFYVDTDVFLTNRLELPLKKDCFVLQGCSGTMLWNRNKGNKKLLKWFEKYEEVADFILKNSENRIEMDRLIDDYGDIRMYQKYGAALKIPSENIKAGVNHFSNIYPYMRDKKTVGIAINPKGSIASFEIESLYAFSLYCYERGYTDNISICFYDPINYQNIGFYT